MQLHFSKFSPFNLPRGFSFFEKKDAKETRRIAACNFFFFSFFLSSISCALRRPTKMLLSVEPVPFFASLSLSLPRPFYFYRYVHVYVCNTEEKRDAYTLGTERNNKDARRNEDLKAPRLGDNYREPTLQPSKGLNVKRYTSRHHYGSFYAPATRGSFLPTPNFTSLSLSLFPFHRFHRSSPRSLAALSLSPSLS